MSFRKAIESGRKHRKNYHGAKEFDRLCRNHGSCSYCEKGRQYKNKRRLPIVDYHQVEEEWYAWEDPDVGLCDDEESSAGFEKLP